MGLAEPAEGQEKRKTGKICLSCNERGVLSSCFLCKMWYDYSIMDKCQQEETELLPTTVSKKMHSIMHNIR